GDIAVDDHEAAARHRVAAYLNDVPVGPGVFEAQFLAERFEAAAQLRLDVLGAEFAALSEYPDVIGIAQALSQQRVRQIEDPLEIQVPGGEPQFGIEHRHPVAYIVEGDAQLGLALADLVQQPGIVHRDYRLRREAFEQRYLFIRERSDLQSVSGDITEQ